MSDDFQLFSDGASYNAVLPFALIQATERGDLKHLLWLLDDATSIGSIGGDPGWSIDRRKPIVDASEYAEWPDWAEYCVQQGEPVSMFEVPLEYVTKERFDDCLRRVLAARGISIAPIEEIWQRNLAFAVNCADSLAKYDCVTLREWIARQPFQPFRLVMSDGTVYEVCEPQKALLSKSEILVAAAASDKVPGGLVACSLLKIVAVELIDSGMASIDEELC